MTSLTRVLIFLAAVLVAPFALWMAVAAANEQEYLALARSGLLLIGLFGMLWGLLRRRLAVAAIGIAFVAVGFLTFLWSRPRANAFDPIEECWWTIKMALCRPLVPFGRMRLWHVLVAAFLVLNGLLIGDRAPARRVAGANIVFLGVALLAILVTMP